MKNIPATKHSFAPVTKRVSLLACSALMLGACVSGDVLESASSSSASQQTQLVQQSTADNTVQDAETSDIMAVPEPAPRPENVVSEQTIQSEAPPSTQLAAVEPDAGQSLARERIDETAGNDSTSLSNTIDIPQANAPRKTYLINGLLSAVPFIGYGFRNLKKKMPEAELYSYMGVVEGPAVIAPKIVKDAEAAYRGDPSTKINLIGISLGADLITVIAERLNEKNVPVNYLGIVDGTNLRPITPNVRVADNLTCSFLDCTKARARLTPGNNTTQLTRKVYKSSHIPLGDHDGLHAHVIARSK